MTSAIGIDLGGTNIKGGIVDRNGVILDRHEVPTRADRGPDAVIGDLVSLVNYLRSSGPVDGIGLATPGPLNLRQGRITHAANLPGWIDVPIRDALAEKTGLPVILENDANAAAYGEFTAGAGRGCQHMTLFTLGTGVGAGVIIDGRVLHGHFDNAGELGHMIVVVSGEPCPCGQRGCLERYSSADAVVRRATHSSENNPSVERKRHDPAFQNRDSMERSPAPIPSVERKRHDIPPPLPRGDRGGFPTERKRHDSPVTAEQVAARAQQGDQRCTEIWNEACLYLAVACVNIQHAYNSQRIILGGGMSQAGDFLLNTVRRHLAEQVWRLHNDLPEIYLAELGADAGLVGAAALFRDHFSKTENPACSK